MRAVFLSYLTTKHYTDNYSFYFVDNSNMIIFQRLFSVLAANEN